MKSAKFWFKVLGLTIFSWSAVGNYALKAQDTALMQCIEKLTDIGVSADAALGECQKNSLKDCIERLLKQKKVVKSVSQEGNRRFLIDLGDNEYDWWEGNGWRDRKCEPNTNGPYRRQSDAYRQEGIFGGGRSFEWFRQGWCSKSEITLDEYYTLEEAKLRCELGYTETESNKVLKQ